MRTVHPGIRIDEIHVEGGGGLIFAGGMIVLLMIAIPAFIPLIAAMTLGGVLLAPVLHWLYYH